MKKILTIGDLHGRNNWKGIDPNLYERIIFVGDYVDSFDKTDDEIGNNLLDILQLKKSYPEKVILLWGNHDVQYLYWKPDCSGYRPTMKMFLGETFNKYQDFFHLAYEIKSEEKNYLWTHAGVHQKWYEEYLFLKHDVLRNLDNFELAEKLNILFHRKYNGLFIVDRIRGGWYPYGGPLWLDKSILKKNPLSNYTQIVGHTEGDEVEILDNLVFVDCPAYPFHIWEIGDKYEEFK